MKKNNFILSHKSLQLGISLLLFSNCNFYYDKKEMRGEHTSKNTSEQPSELNRTEGELGLSTITHKKEINNPPENDESEYKSCCKKFCNCFKKVYGCCLVPETNCYDDASDEEFSEFELTEVTEEAPETLNEHKRSRHICFDKRGEYTKILDRRGVLTKYDITVIAPDTLLPVMPYLRLPLNIPVRVKSNEGKIKIQARSVTKKMLRSDFVFLILDSEFDYEKFLSFLNGPGKNKNIDESNCSENEEINACKIEEKNHEKRFMKREESSIIDNLRELPYSRKKFNVENEKKLNDDSSKKSLDETDKSFSETIMNFFTSFISNNNNEKMQEKGPAINEKEKEPTENVLFNLFGAKEKLNKNSKKINNIKVISTFLENENYLDIQLKEVQKEWNLIYKRPKPYDTNLLDKFPDFQITSLLETITMISKHINNVKYINKWFLVDGVVTGKSNAKVYSEAFVKVMYNSKEQIFQIDSSADTTNGSTKLWIFIKTIPNMQEKELTCGECEVPVFCCNKTCIKPKKYLCQCCFLPNQVECLCSNNFYYCKPLCCLSDCLPECGIPACFPCYMPVIPGLNVNHNSTISCCENFCESCARCYI